MNLVSMLPMAFVMIAGPQILSAIFLATGDGWRRTSAMYTLGAALSITLFVTIGFFVGSGASDQGASDDAIYVAILVLLLAAMARTYAKRKESKPPKWMGTLQTASPGFAFKLGFLLLGVFPTDILTSFAVGSYLSTHGDPWSHCLPFVALTLLLLALPSLALLAFGDRAQKAMPRVRDWMNTNSWIVNEVVLALFVVLTINSLG